MILQQSKHTKMNSETWIEMNATFQMMLLLILSGRVRFKNSVLSG